MSFKTVPNSFMHQITEAYMKMNESLTIPMNQNDPIEKQLYSKLDRNYKYSDFIVRWYRNDKKANYGADTLQRTYVDNLDNIIDLLNDYESYIAELQRRGALKDTISLPTLDGKTWKMNPIKDFPSIRRLDGLKTLVMFLGDQVHQMTNIKSTVSKYTVTDADRRNIRIVGFTEHVVLWATRTFESTNKLVFQLWQNAKTMDRGDVYGDKDVQSPYCTHAPNHWNSYSKGYKDYQQFWYFIRIPALPVAMGDLTNPTVAEYFNGMAGTGAKTIIAMNDTGNDFLDDNDHDFDSFTRDLMYGSEVQYLHENLFVEVGYRDMKWERTWGEGDWDDEDDDTELYLKSEYHGDGKLEVGDVTIEDSELGQLPYGIPKHITGTFCCCGCTNLRSLNGAPEKADMGFDIYGCPRLSDQDILSHVNVPKSIHILYDARTSTKKGTFTELSDGVEFLVSVDDIEEVYGSDYRNSDMMSFEAVKSIIANDGIGMFDDYDYQMDFNSIDTDYFDNTMDEFDIDFSDIQTIFEGDGDDLVDEKKMDSFKMNAIKELVETDFDGNGNSLYDVHRNCCASGAEKEAYDDVYSKLFDKFPFDKEYGVQEGVMKIKMNMKQCLDYLRYTPSDSTEILAPFCMNDDFELEKFSIDEPYYGYSGFNNEQWNKALKTFTDNVYSIISRPSPVKDAEGQMYFDFDKDYLDNPNNIPREKLKTNRN